jgi:CheY-like chemotaxis protein
MERVAALAVSGYARSEDRERSLLAGYHAHVAKPFEIVALADAIARLRAEIAEQTARRPAQDRAS